ncbi:hypothetical protein [Pseudomonas sp. GL-RE-19]|uniref:hypothetical protein n=2 Tax=Pseudomonas TaxID=286 RepID=UPI0029583D75|nr:hypothetical protein [Pseudomonas sp. GL-RE-19]
MSWKYRYETGEKYSYSNADTATPSGRRRMKYFILAGVLALLAILKVGYYEEHSEHEIYTIFFVKKTPTLRVKFFNIHANDGDYRRIETLSDERRQKIKDYCKYRLGIETEVKTQADIVMCAN